MDIFILTYEYVTFWNMKYVILLTHCFFLSEKELVELKNSSSMENIERGNTRKS